MGLLDKRNPEGTARTVIFHACGTSASAFVLGIAVLAFNGDFSHKSLFFVALMAICGLVVGGLYEWQMPDE